MELKKLPKKELGFFPTPLMYLENLSKFFGGPKLLMKRDDMTGLAFGGNKTRKLEYLIGDAIQKKCDTLITGGAAQSNHCRQTAAAAAMSGLECHLALGGDDSELSKGNLLIDKILGVEIHWTGEFRKGEKIPELADELRSKGKKPYIIPYGGSNPIGAYGFIAAMEELKLQLMNKNLIVQHIVFSSSSGGTHTGILLGNKIFELDANIIGIKIDKTEMNDMPYEKFLFELIGDTIKFLELSIPISSSEIILNDNYLGKGYGVVGDLERNAIKLLAKHEGILLDPVYTGRTMGGLLDMIDKNNFSKNDTVLFWHTGGTPAIFSYADDIIK